MRKDLVLAGRLLAASVLLALAACGGRPPAERIDLPPTSVLSIRSTWAVVTSPFLRVRGEPRAEAPVLTHIRRGAVVEVLSRTERKEELDEASNYWYQVSYGGLRGWVFGAFLEVLDSRAKAESMAAQLE